MRTMICSSSTTKCARKRCASTSRSTDSATFAGRSCSMLWAVTSKLLSAYAYYPLCQLGERLLDAGAGLRAGTLDGPAGLPHFLDARLGDIPGLDVDLVEQAQERNVADLGSDPRLDVARDVQRLRARHVDDEQIPGRAPEVTRAYCRDFVFAGDVPDHEADRRRAYVDGLLVDLHSDRREVLVGKNAGDETLCQAGLANAKGAQQAYFLLQHGFSTCLLYTS